MLKSFTQIPLKEIQSISTVVWDIIHSHPQTATCECPVATVVEELLKKGYQIYLPEEEVDA